MITIVHGSDQHSSRNYFLEQKDKDSTIFDAQSLNAIELSQSIQGSGLFGATIKIFIDNLFTRKGLKNLEIVVEIIAESKNADVYLWADKEIGAKNLSSFPKFENQNFKIPQNIWSFLDGIRPMSSSNVSSFHKTLGETEAEIIFSMIVRQFRLMLGLIENSNLPAGKAGDNIDEVKRLAPWQKSKLTRQASLFGEEKLKKIYKKLYKIDKSLKTGKTPLTLIQNIDILLLEI